ncbi:MAG: hypothetical protein KQA40_00905 [Candidatus Aenigmarchaeota archaeon]|nr:hypothetical protein [Candidatus Aenigmarchaeota archaeon]
MVLGKIIGKQAKTKVIIYFIILIVALILGVVFSLWYLTGALIFYIFYDLLPSERSIIHRLKTEKMMEQIQQAPQKTSTYETRHELPSYPITSPPSQLQAQAPLEEMEPSEQQKSYTISYGTPSEQPQEIKDLLIKFNQIISAMNHAESIEKLDKQYNAGTFVLEELKNKNYNEDELQNLKRKLQLTYNIIKNKISFKKVSEEIKKEEEEEQKNKPWQV